MPNRVTVPIQPGYDETFRSRTGLVGRMLDNRAERVQDAARRQAGLWKNRLKPSMTREWVSSSSVNRLSIRVGTNVKHALVHHEGARPHTITARNNGVLRYEKNGRVFFARSVSHPGHRANRYLTDNLHLAIRP